MKKILKIILFIILTISNVNAITLDKIIETNEWIPNEFVNKVKGTHIKYQTMNFLRRKSDNDFVYCIEPGISINGNVSYNGYDDDYVNVTKFEKETWNRISKLAYYGYGYQDENYDHTDVKWYVITQFMIWQSVPSLYDEIYFTDKLNGKKIEKYITEMQEMETLISTHNILPEFNINKSYQVNSQINLIDKNNVLNKFNIINNDKNLIIDKKGNKIIITAKKVGKYEINLEKKSNKFNRKRIIYINPKSQMVLYAGDLNNISHKFSIEFIGGNVSIEKYDRETNLNIPQHNASFEGAIYGIYNEHGEKIDELKTDKTGKAISNYLNQYGKFYLMEEKAPTGYKLSDEKYYFEIDENNLNPSIKVYDDIIRGKIKIIKNDYDTNSCIPQGQAQLENTEFVIINDLNKIVDKIKINNDCFALSKLLPYGQYKIKELKPAQGYYQNNEIKNQFISNTYTYNIIFKNKVIKNWINIEKNYGNVDGNSTFINTENNIKFEIYYPNGQKFDEIVTDSNGHASILIPYGIWKFHQVNTTSGYDKIDDFNITINENTALNQNYNILNNELSSYIKVIKIDKETKKAINIANTLFKIFNKDTNKYVSEFLGNKIVNTFKTDNNGLMTTYLKLKKGHYKLIEIQSPNGYLINENGLDFEISNETNFIKTNHGNFIKLIYEDEPIKGKIIIKKQGENFIIENGSYHYNNINLENIKFNIYAQENITSPDKKHLIFKKDSLIETIITNKNGNAESSNLPLGKYYVIEKSSNDKYILNNNKYKIELNQIDNKTPLIIKTLNIINKLKTGNIEISKIDDKTNCGIANTNIELYTNDDKLIFSGTTDKNGKIVIRNIILGNYYVKEKEASQGYVLNTNKLNIKIAVNNEIVKINIPNKKITSTINIKKTDNNYKPIENVEISLYNNDDVLIKTYLTNKEGKISFCIPYGKYYIKETKTNDNYILDNSKTNINVCNDNENININLINKIRKIKVPNTYSCENRKKFLTLTLIITTILLLVTMKKLKPISILFILSIPLITIIYLNNKYKNIPIKNNNITTKLNTNYNKPNEIKINNVINKKRINYIGYLEIPKISLKKGFVNKNSPYNNVNKNIQILKESDMPNKKNGMVMIAGHSGTGNIAYFKNLYKLNINDIVIIYYNNIKYTYKIIDIYLEDKNGEISVQDNNNFSSIILTTCSNKKGKQQTFWGKLTRTETTL